MKKIILLLALLVNCTANANEYIYLGALSHHFNSHPKDGWEEYAPPSGHPCYRYNSCVTGGENIEYQYNENHHLIGYQKYGYLVAHFDNSFNQSTWLVARQFESEPRSNLTFIAAVGATHGYTDCDYEDSGTNATTCPYYQVGVAYSRFKLQPILATTGSVITLSFRLQI